MFKPVSPNVNFPGLEKKILDYWYSSGIVKKYLHKNDKSVKRFSFLDGPITANNPMGVHHAWGRTYKDLWQRFYNMRGFKQRFQNGFDCQGLWIEVEVEKELGIKNKKEIENLVRGDKKRSIAKFVEMCKARVEKFSELQTEQSKRLGYFMDWDNSYYTYSDENNYMIWHFLKFCHDNGWIYKGRDSVPWCPRCQTAISQHEMLTEDYKELTHETVFVKLPITTMGWNNTYLLIWTTTPWTVPANVAVGVNVKFTYRVWQNTDTGEKIIFFNRDENGFSPIREWNGRKGGVSDFIFEEGVKGEYKDVKDIRGKDLLKLKYGGPFDNLPIVQIARKENTDKFHTVIDASEVVTATEGTGLLHVAPGAGKEDFDLGKKEKLSVISVIDDEANYLDEMGEFSGKNAKKHPEIIIEYLQKYDNGRFLLKTMPFTHRYPACWRCKTELVWKVADEWYIAMDRPKISNLKAQRSKLKNKTLREQMIEVAKKIRWIPDFGLERELDWLKNMHDWLISKKNRYWGLALPIYECQKCGWFDVVGSREELKEKAVSGWEEASTHSPHKPYIDEVKVKCKKCQTLVSRVDDVGNVWLDAGIVSFSTLVDPITKKLSYTTDKRYWKDWFPADFITESFPGQFKNWFYSLIAMSTVLEAKNPFETVLGFASVLGEDGRPMHKSWGNAVEFNQGADKIGVDVMRWMYVTQNPEENLLFGFKKADETRRKFHLMLWNIYNFFVTYANVDKWQRSGVSHQSKNVLDKWIMSKLNQLVKTVTESLEKYDAFTASHVIQDFVNDLSTWYVRRSRERVGPTVEDGENKNFFYTTLWEVLASICQILTPFTPFLAEEIYQNLTGEDSVHLSDWPTVGQIDREIDNNMEMVRKICELGHAARKKEGIKVRQPLQELRIKNFELRIDEEFISLIKEELNVKDVKITGGSGDLSVQLDTELTPGLRGEGEARELVRKIQLKRKELGCSLTDKVNVFVSGWPINFTEYIKKQALIEKIFKDASFRVEKV